MQGSGFRIQGAGLTKRASQIGQFMFVVLIKNCSAKRHVTNRHIDQIRGRRSLCSTVCGGVWGGCVRSGLRAWGGYAIVMRHHCLRHTTTLLTCYDCRFRFTYGQCPFQGAGAECVSERERGERSRKRGERKREREKAREMKSEKREREREREGEGARRENERE